MATISIGDDDARYRVTLAVTKYTTQIPITFPFFDLDDIKVIRTLNGVDQTFTRGTVTSNHADNAYVFEVLATAVDDGYSGGNIRVSETNTSPQATYTIYRDIPVARTVDFPTSGVFNVNALNTEVDKLWAAMQQLETEVGRSVRMIKTDADNLTITLPSSANRSGEYLYFDANGDLTTRLDGASAVMNPTYTSLYLEGATSNDYELQIVATDPTADRVWTIPDSTDTFVGLTGSQTLTNKTLTDPVINGNITGTALQNDATFASTSPNKVASSQSVKAYVDAQVDTKDALAELDDVALTGGNSPNNNELLGYDSSSGKWTSKTGSELGVMPATGGTFTGDVLFDGYIDILWDKSQNSFIFKDGAELRFGDNYDLLLKHNFNNSYIQNKTGDLIIGNYYNSSGDIKIQNKIGNDGIVVKRVGSTDSVVELYHDDSLKFETTSSGVKTTGTLDINGAYNLPTSIGNSGQVLRVPSSGTELEFFDNPSPVYGKSNTNSLKLEENVLTNDVLLMGTNHVKGRTYTEFKTDLFTDSDLTITSTDAGATADPSLILYRNSASPADNDVIGNMFFKGKNWDGSATVHDVNYAGLEAKIKDVTDGTEDAELRLKVMSNSTLQDIITLKGNASTLFSHKDVLFGQNVDIRFEGATANAHETSVTVVDPTADNTITLPDATGTVLLQDSSSDVTITNPSDKSVLFLYRNSTSPSNADFAGEIIAKGRNDASQDVEYSKISTQITDVTDGTEDGNLGFYVRSDGGQSVRLNLKGNNASEFSNKNVRFSTGVNLEFEGATNNAYETIVTVTDPTQDNTITLPDATGQVVLSSGGIDTNASAEIGRAHIGDVGFNDFAGFSHVDQNSTTGYAFLQYATGQTFINAPTGQNIKLRNNNTDIAEINSGGLLLNTNSIIAFEGATNDTNETALTVTDPTADRTITLPDASGTVALTSDLSSFGTLSNIVEDTTPQLGGTLDTNGNDIDLNGTGSIILDADGDSKISASVDDNIVFNIGTGGNLTLKPIGEAWLHSSTSPTIYLTRTDSSPNDGDKVGDIHARGKDDAGNELTYGQIEFYSETVGNGAERGSMVLSLHRNNGMQDYYKADATSGFEQNIFYKDIKVDTGVNLVFEGATSNANETTLTVTDPTADRTITFPDASGTVALTSQLGGGGGSSAADDITTGDAAVNIETSSGNITIDAQGNDTDIIFKGTDNNADITMLTLDGSEAGDATLNGNLGVGTTPNANYLDTSWNAIDVSAKGGLVAYDGTDGVTGETLIVTNAYHNGTSWKAKATGESSGYSAKQDGTHTFYGTKGTSANADADVTLYTQMSINAGGDLGINTNPSASNHFQKVNVNIGQKGGIVVDDGGAYATYLTQNLYIDGSTWKTRQTGTSGTSVVTQDGTFYVFKGSSVSAGQTPSFTEEFKVSNTLDGGIKFHGTDVALATPYINASTLLATDSDLSGTANPTFSSSVITDDYDYYDVYFHDVKATTNANDTSNYIWCRFQQGGSTVTGTKYMSRGYLSGMKRGDTWEAAAWAYDSQYQMYLTYPNAEIALGVDSQATFNAHYRFYNLRNTTTYKGYRMIDGQYFSNDDNYGTPVYYQPFGFYDDTTSTSYDTKVDGIVFGIGYGSPFAAGSMRLYGWKK